MALALVLLWVQFLHAQDETRQKVEQGSNAGEFFDRNTDLNQVLIVPFEDKMYRSVADPASPHTSSENYELYRKALEEALRHELTSWGLNVSSELPNDVLQDRIYPGLGYRTEKMQWPDPESKGAKKGLSKKKSSTKERSGTYIQNGQLRTVRDTATKVMTAVFLDPALQPWLHDEYNNGQTVFLTQLEIVPRDPLRVAGYGLDTATCVVQVHGSLYSGKEKVQSTLARSSYQPCWLPPSKIIELNFSDLAVKIATLLKKEEE